MFETGFLEKLRSFLQRGYDPETSGVSVRRANH